MAGLESFSTNTFSHLPGVWAQSRPDAAETHHTPGRIWLDENQESEDLTNVYQCNIYRHRKFPDD